MTTMNDAFAACCTSPITGRPSAMGRYLPTSLKRVTQCFRSIPALLFAANVLLVVSVPTASAADGWQPTGSMLESRYLSGTSNNSAIVLKSGKVLITGGRDVGPSGGFTRKGAELYDPSNGTWSRAGFMTTPRSDHSATLLPDGKVLLAGGNTADGAVEGHTATAEIYDPVTGTFTLTGSMSTPRVNHGATLLVNGKVLIAGGRSSNFNYLSSAEIYDPSTGIFTPTGSLPVAETGGAATLLADGRVLVSGGIVPYVSTKTAEVYDPATGNWTSVGPMLFQRTYHTAARLSDGSVLIVGGSGSGGESYGQSSTEVFDPASNTFTLGAPMANARFGHSMETLLDGRVLVVAGQFLSTMLNSAELYDPSLGTWSAAASYPVPTANAYSVLLNDGRVLVTGGTISSDGLITASSAALYGPLSPNNNTITKCPCAGPMGTSSPWNNHGQYVSCVAKVANDLVKSGQLPSSERGAIVSMAALSSCGK